IRAQDSDIFRDKTVNLGRTQVGARLCKAPESNRLVIRPIEIRSLSLWKNFGVSPYNGNASAASVWVWTQVCLLQIQLADANNIQLNISNVAGHKYFRVDCSTICVNLDSYGNFI